MLRAAKNYLKLSAEVQQALHEKKAVLALESTVISHGLPYPRNLELANTLESVARANNAVPATIALLDGKVHIGLTEKQLEQVADPSSKAVKVSQRDIPYVLANKNLIGGTTVAATMYLANLAGIRVFSTGGIGGVHRGAEETFDISADLIELSRTPVAVVCAGVKSILNIGKTLEYMETHGVGVVVHGKTRAFPGFFVPETEFKAPWNFESLEDIANVLVYGRAMNMQNGTVIACPIPEELAADAKSIEKAIKKALKETREQKIASKDVTPFILKRVSEITKGSSVETNIGLLKNNVLVGAELANILAAKERGEHVTQRKSRVTAGATKSEEEKPKPKVVCIGGTNLDFEAHTDLLKVSVVYLARESTQTIIPIVINNQQLFIKFIQI